MAEKKVSLDGLGAATIPQTLGSVLELTTDAVIAFDGMGRIIMANEQARQLFGAKETMLFGHQIQELFAKPYGAAERPAISALAKAGENSIFWQLPFPSDGSSVLVSLPREGDMPLELRVRCEKTSAASDTYVLCAHDADESVAQSREQERMVKDLTRANRRLSGTLRIVLDTLDNDDMSQLFSRTLEEIAETMEATGTLVYLAEPDGFHLRGHTASLADSALPPFLSYRNGMSRALLRSEHALRLRVLAPTTSDLRAGRTSRREVIDEETHEAHKVPSKLVPPFASFIAVPVWFGGHVIAVIEVGWERLHPTTKEDGRLLDAVASYLSVQLMGAFTQMRTEHAARLEALHSDLREKLYAAGEPSPEDGLSFFSQMAEGIGCIFCHVEENDYGPTAVAYLPNNGMRALPMEAEDIVGSKLGNEVALARIEAGSRLSDWLSSLGECSIGAFVDAGKVMDQKVAFMVLRPQDAEPLDTDELSFIHKCTDDFCELMAGTARRMQDKRISQALQLGMRNELQEVEGLTASGIYSSATADAFVGGDFYDLIRLPQRRAAVIMGDVSGKGVEAASVSAAVKTALGAYAWEGLAPARMVRSLNDFLLGFSRIETFATLFIGLIDIESGKISYCSAGHPPAILYRAKRGELETLDVQSGVVGAFEDMTYIDGETTADPGDFLLLYTDGTTEARNPVGAFFGEDGLKDAIMQQIPKGFDGILDRLLATLDTFTARNLDDDVAMVAVRYDGLRTQDGPEAAPSAK